MGPTAVVVDRMAFKQTLNRIRQIETELAAVRSELFQLANDMSRVMRVETVPSGGTRVRAPRRREKRLDTPDEEA